MIDSATEFDSVDNVFRRQKEVKVNVDETTNGSRNYDAKYKLDQKEPLSTPPSHMTSAPIHPSHNLPNLYQHQYPHQQQQLQQYQQMPQYYSPYTNQNSNSYPHTPLSQHPYHQQYPSPPQPPSFPYVANSNTNRPNSWLVPATLAATAGTLIGVSAAATVRWLNGDDWYFVTSNPKTSEPSLEKNIESQTLLEGRNSTLDNAKSETRQKTDQAMEILRQQTQLDAANSNHSMESQLRDIQQSLAAIQEALQLPRKQDSDHQNINWNVELESHLSSVLMKLEGIVDMKKDETVAVSEIIENTPIIGPTKIHSAEPIKNTDPTDKSDIPVVDETSNSMSQVTSASTRLELREAFTKLIMGRPDGSPNDFLAGVQSLYLFTLNISRQPHVPRYRRIYCENDNYRNHVRDLDGAVDLLKAVGFEQSEPPHPQSRVSKYWDWLPSSSSRRKADSTEMQDIEAMYLERLREAVIVLEVVKAASQDTGHHDLIQQALTAARLIEDNDTHDISNDLNRSDNGEIDLSD